MARIIISYGPYYYLPHSCYGADNNTRDNVYDAVITETVHLMNVERL